jgi:WD40 repeat protein
MTNDKSNSNDEIQMTKRLRARGSPRFVIRSFGHSSLIRHSSFVIRRLFILPLLCGTTVAADKITYDDLLLPILRNECTSCHNPDKKKGGLDLSSYQAILSGSDSGPVVNAGDPDGSKLYKVVAHLDEPNMPKGKGKLADKDINVFKQWIAGGMLENAGGKAVVAKGKPAVNLAIKMDLGKPKGPIAMPHDLSLEPLVHTARPGALMCLASSPWAPLVAIGGQHQVLFYNTNTLELLGVLPFSEGEPYVARFSRNGGMLLVGGGVAAKSGHVNLFDVATGNRIAKIGDEFDAVIAADISPDQSTVALGGPGKTLKIYSTADNQLLHAIKKHTDWVTAIAYSPDNVLLASGDRAGGLWVWEAKSGNEFYGLTGHKAAITSLCFRDDSNILASTSEDGTVKLWEMENGKLVKSWNAHPPGALSVAFTHDGRIVTCGRDRLVHLWKPDGSGLLTTQPFNDIALQATFDGDGNRVVAGDWSGTVRVFDAKSSKPVGELTADPLTVAERLSMTNKQLAEAQVNYDKTLAALDQAARQLNQAKAQAAQLETAQARHEVSARQAALEKAKRDADTATSAAKKLDADLALAKKLVEGGPHFLQVTRKAIASAEQGITTVTTARDAAQRQLLQQINFAQQAGQIAQSLADSARKARPDKYSAEAAAKGKALFDLLNQNVEIADRELLHRSVDLEKARRDLAAAEANVKRQDATIESAPAQIASLEQALQLARADARKKGAEADHAAQAVSAAQANLAKLAAQYQQTTQAK